MSIILNLRLVEIELFSYCNRKCIWCPNRDIDRKSFNTEISDEVFYRLLTELKDAEYQGAITFSRYNEPMSHIDIFSARLKQIKNILPYNKLITNTNGDFLTKENLDKLSLDELTIMDYDCQGPLPLVEKLLNIGATIDLIKYPYIYAHRDKMQILYFINWPEQKKLTDRGGFLKEFSAVQRTTPCYEPYYFIGINYDGTVSPCCNIRSDIPAFNSYLIGDLNKNSLSEILAGERNQKFQQQCAHADFLEGSPCFFCSNTGGRYTQGKNGISYE